MSGNVLSIIAGAHPRGRPLHAGNVGLAGIVIIADRGHFPGDHKGAPLP